MRKEFTKQRWWFGLVLVLILGGLPPANAQSWSNGYAFQRAITIDHTKVPNTDQASFPLLISGTYSFLASTANGGDVTSANGYDIVFTSDAAGASLLPFEQESYSPTTGAINYWVQVPSLSHTTDTVIYVFYGNGAVTSDQSNRAAVWDSNYKGVWHLPNGTTLSASDSTSTGNNGTNNGATAATGKIGGGAGFNGSNQDIQLASATGSLDLTGTLTLEVWANPSALPQSSNSYNGLITKGYDGSHTQYQLDFQDDSSTGNVPQLLFATYNGSGHSAQYTYGSNITTGNWYHIVGSFDGSTYRLFVNGQQVASSASTVGPSHANKVPLLGAFDLNGSIHYFNGFLDEARISNSARSADWIATEYTNQSAPATFYSVGAAVVNGLNGSTAPYIAGLWPSSGPVTMPVTILGANFGTTQGSSTVAFNGTQGTPTLWGNAAILVPVPSGAASGSVVVTVGSSSSNPSSFTVTNAPRIVSLAPTNGLVGAWVTLTGVNFGTTQGSSTVTLSGVSCSIVSWSTTSITVTVPANASSGPFTLTVGGVATSSSIFTVSAVPTGWSDQDIGSVGQTGSSSYSNGVFTVNGAGSGIGGTANSFHYVYQPLSGDGTIVARVVSSTGSSAKGGVMISETLSGGSANAGTAMTSSCSARSSLYRTAVGNNELGTNISSSCPQWVQVARSGNSFSMYTSSDGVNWVQIDSTQTINMAQNVYIGLFVTSGSTSTLGTVKFDNVSVNSSANPAPVITAVSATTGSVGSQVVISGTGFGTTQAASVVLLNGTSATINSWSATSITITIPAGATSGYLVVSVAPTMNNSNPVDFTVTANPLPTGWLDRDIGSVGLAGTASYSTSGQFTVNGAGNGISAAPDSFHFVYQPLSGDGTIVARVVSSTGSGTMAGVMISETLDGSSTNAFTEITGCNFKRFMYRTTAGTNEQGSNNSGSCPYWVKLTRSGSTFAGYASTDGVNWSQLGSSQTITMAQNVYVGLVVTSASTSTLTTATFDDVSVNTSSNPAPAITSTSATTGSVGSQIVISGTGFGTVQGGGAVLLNGTSATVDSWVATSITVTIPAGATSGYLVVAVAPFMNDSNPVSFTVTSNPLPSGWLNQDIGSVGLAGGASYSNGTFVVSGAGNGVINTTADAIQLVYQQLSGDGTILARVASAQGSGRQEAGVLVRETLNSGATNAASADYAYAPGFDLVQRTSTGATSSLYNAGQAVSTTPPYWLKLTRTGNTFNGYASPDGTYWSQVGTTQTISMAQTVYIGLFVDNETTNSLATASFDSVALTTGTPASPPTVTSASPVVAGAGYTVTITGSGFGPAQGTSQAYFNGVPASSITSWSDTQVVATVPPSATTGPVTVVVNGLGSNRTVSITIYAITSITPPAAQTGGIVTIAGSGFGSSQGSSIVSFNGVAAAVSSWSNTSITATVPSSATSGPVTISQSGAGGNGFQFTVLEPLVVSGYSPSGGPVGSAITINGAGFGPTQSNSSVSFYGAQAANIASWSDTQIVATVPGGASSGPVGVTVAGQTGWGPSFLLTSSTQVTDSLGNPSTYNTGVIGGMWVLISATGSGCSSCTVRGTIQNIYDVNGNVLTRTDELGRITTYTYDTSNNVASVSIPYNGTNLVTSYAYNNFGEVLTATDPMGNVTTNTYDTNGNLTKVTTPVPSAGVPASVTQFGYNSLGQLTSITDPLNNATTLAYTATGLIQTITDAQNNVTTYGYDSHGNRTSVTDALNHTTTFTYDSGDRLTKITYPDTTTTQFGYDYRGRRTSVTDQNGKITGYAYDDADRLTSVTDAANNVTTYGYDTENNLTSITDANSHTTNFAYDAFGRVTQTTFPSSAVETYSYDAVGNLTGKTDRKNQSISYTYDQLNRLTQKQYPDNSTVNYTYDNDSRLTQVTDPTGTYSFTFDNMGRLTGTATQYAFLTGRTFTTAYGYDAASNRTGFTDPEGGSTGYAYDTLNRLQTLTPPAAISGGSFGFSYDTLSRRTNLTRPNAVNTTYGYDNLSRLLSVVHAKSGTTIDGATYTVDNAGNRTSKSDLQAGVTTNYGYDNIYQLLSATPSSGAPESYTYDPVGNRLSSAGAPSYSYNSSNQLTSTSSVTYGYDLDGNTTSKADSTGTTSYTWDFENRLTSVTLPGSGGIVGFKYDPFGRRIYKTTSAGTSVYAYDQDNLIEETNASGTVIARYTQSLNIDETLAMTRAGATSYYHADGLGSVTSLSNAVGSVAQTYTFDSFGKATATSGSLTNPFQYAGRELDSETMLYYMRARYFDPTTGRFLSEDPVETEGNDLNFYRYVENNPVGFTDPTGLQRVNSPRLGPPNSTAWFPNPNDPNEVTVRVYGPNGEAVTDYDYGHDHGYGDPHAHDWGKDKNGKITRKPRRIKPGEKVPPKTCPPPTPQPTPRVPVRALIPWGPKCIPGITCYHAEDGNYYPIGGYPMLPPTAPAGPVPAPNVQIPQIPVIRLPELVLP